jgi:hypothetical protein
MLTLQLAIQKDVLGDGKSPRVTPVSTGLEALDPAGESKFSVAGGPTASGREARAREVEAGLWPRLLRN